MRDLLMEDYLKRLCVPFTYLEGIDEIDIDSIDLQLSLRNQARLECPLDKNRVEQYANLMKMGSPFVAPVFYEKGTKRILVVGNHRTHAKVLAGHTHTDAYRLDTANQTLIDAIAKCSNIVTNGKEISEEEKMAVFNGLVADGHSNEAIRQHTGLSAGTIKRFTAAARITMILGGPSGLSTAHDTALSRLRTHQDYLVECAAFAAQVGMTATRLNDLATALLNTRLEIERKEILNAWKNNPEFKEKRALTMGGKRKAPQTEQTRLFESLNRLSMVLKAESLKKLGLTTPELQMNFRNQYLEVRQLCDQVLDQIEEEQELVKSESEIPAQLATA